MKKKLIYAIPQLRHTPNMPLTSAMCYNNGSQASGSYAGTGLVCVAGSIPAKAGDPNSCYVGLSASGTECYGGSDATSEGSLCAPGGTDSANCYNYSGIECSSTGSSINDCEKLPQCSTGGDKS
jgi:hypothetical protein